MTVAAALLVATGVAIHERTGDDPPEVATSPERPTPLLPPERWTVDSTIVDDSTMVTPDGCGPVWAGSTPDGATLAFGISPAPDGTERAPGSPEAADAVITDGPDGQLTLTTVAGDVQLTFVAHGLARPDLRAIADTARHQLATAGLDLDALPLPDGFRLLPAPSDQASRSSPAPHDRPHDRPRDRTGPRVPLRRCRLAPPSRHPRRHPDLGRPRRRARPRARPRRLRRPRPPRPP